MELISLCYRYIHAGLSPKFPDQEDVTVAFPDSIVRISCMDLLMTLKQCSLETTAASKRSSERPASSGGSIFGGWGGGRSRKASWGGIGAYEATNHDVKPIPFQRWELPRGIKGCMDAVCLGHAPRDLYRVLQGSLDDRDDLMFCVGEQ